MNTRGLLGSMLGMLGMPGFDKRRGPAGMPLPNADQIAARLRKTGDFDNYMGKFSVPPRYTGPGRPSSGRNAAKAGLSATARASAGPRQRKVWAPKCGWNAWKQVSQRQLDRGTLTVLA